MKKVVTFLLILILVASPVVAYSINDLFTDIKLKIMGIKGLDTTQIDLIECREDEVRCGECGGYPCVMSCSNNGWIEEGYCMNQCLNGECITQDEGDIDIFKEELCNENEVRCGTDEECEGSPCVMSCSNNEWIEEGYCMDQCLNGECITQPPQQCNDGTQYNQCSNNKPLFCNNGILEDNCNTCGCPTNEECTNNACIERRSGEESGDQDRLNIPPIVSPIEDKIIKIGESINFKIRAIDQNNDILTSRIENNLNIIIECSILDNTVNCKAIKEGETKLIIITSDQIDETETEVKITIIKELPELQRGITAGVANTPPTADAGSDKIGIPGAPILLDASLSYDQEGLSSSIETYKWYEDNNLMGKGKTIEKTFQLGTHNIKLVVTDTEGKISEDIIIIHIKQKETCKDTQTIYYPKDTLCNNKWPIKEGEELKINSLTKGACGLFEVCSEDLDPIIEDSINCCTEKLMDPNKLSTCNFALENTENLKNCQAHYIIQSLGRSAIYMKEYGDFEMCCKGVDVLCPNQNYLYKAEPLPSWLQGKGLKCSNNPDNNPNGLWKSDTNLALNEVALSDVPAHVSLNILKTGTCVDYSVSATTLLRKIGFSKDKVMTVEASDHAYNLIKFESDKYFTIFDMTGNNNGLIPGKVPKGYNYCQNIKFCYNDVGKVICPSNNEITGCIGVKENIGRNIKIIGNKITGTLKELINKLIFEVKR